MEAQGINNAALLHLSSPLKLSEYVNVVDLPKNRDINLESANCTLLGFGVDSSKKSFGNCKVNVNECIDNNRSILLLNSESNVQAIIEHTVASQFEGQLGAWNQQLSLFTKPRRHQQQSEWRVRVRKGRWRRYEPVPWQHRFTPYLFSYHQLWTSRNGSRGNARLERFVWRK